MYTYIISIYLYIYIISNLRVCASRQQVASWVLCMHIRTWCAVLLPCLCVCVCAYVNTNILVV